MEKIDRKKPNKPKKNINTKSNRKTQTSNRDIRQFPTQTSRNRNQTTRNLSYVREDKLRYQSRGRASTRDTRDGLNKRPQNTKPKQQTKTRKRNLRALSRGFTSILFIIIITYFLVFIYKSLNIKTIDYGTIEYGTIDNQKLSTGVVIRDEKVYKAPKDGTLSFNIPEHEKVIAGEEVAKIRNTVDLTTTEQELEEINKKIMEIQQNRDKLSLFSEDVKKIEAQIQTLVEDSMYQFSENNVLNIYKLQDYVNKKMEVRNQMLLSEKEGSVEDLVSKKVSKENEINSNIQSSNALASGILSYYTDGLEDTFSFDNIKKLTKEQTKMNSNGQDVSYYKIQVLKDEPIFKIVENNYFYIAAYIKTDYIIDWKENTYKKIYVKKDGGYDELEVYIEKLELGEKESYVLMKSTKFLLDYIQKRSVSFEVNKPKQGFKIYNQSIVEENLLKIPSNFIIEDTVIKKTQNGNQKILLGNIQEDEASGYYNVPIQFGVLNVGDTILTEDLKKEFIIKDINTVKGLYIINSGIYDFKPINLENSIENSDFTIIDPSFNQNILLYDRYLKDVKQAKENTQIYN